MTGPHADHALECGHGFALVHGAERATATREIIAPLVAHGSHLGAAARGEIAPCRSEGLERDHITCGNTCLALMAAIALFAADAEEAVEMMPIHSGGALCTCMMVENCQAGWPLNRRFGCRAGPVPERLARAVGLGPTPLDLSFDQGSSAKRPELWAPWRDQVAGIRRDLAARGYAPDPLTIGGGRPALPVTRSRR